MEPVERRVARARAALAECGEAARAMLREMFPDAIRLTPDVSGRYMWAMFDADIAPLLDAEERFRACGFQDSTREDLAGSIDSKRLMVAGACYAMSRMSLSKLG